MGAGEGCYTSRVPTRSAIWMLPALLIFGCETPASAPEEPDESSAADYRSAPVERAMQEASEVLRTRGFEEMGVPRRGFLVEQAADVSEQAMRAGTCYVLLAAATTAMRELTIRVFDSDGGEVVQDTTTGPRAALRYCPAQSGTHFATAEASAGTGLFELRWFRGPTGLEIRIDDLFRTPPEARETR